MKLIELTEIYNKIKKQLLLNLANILQSATKKCQKKGGEEKYLNFFLLKHVIKRYKKSMLYY